MMWSDPRRGTGMKLNERGSGINFGPDVTRDWLKRNHCQALVRSHECMEEGAEVVQISSTLRLFTVFSASNYSGGDNFAAILKYTSLEDSPEIIRFRTMDSPLPSQVKEGNTIKLEDLVCRRHYRLERAFQQVDPDRTGQLAMDVWQKALEETLNFQNKDWSRLGLDVPMEGNMVLYPQFLTRYSVRTLGGDSSSTGTPAKAASPPLITQDASLKLAFATWDVNNYGKVYKPEFVQGINVLNEGNPDREQLDADSLFRLLDFDDTGWLASC